VTADVLVTGGSGYFGSVLVEQLVDAGHRVRNLDVNAPDHHPPGVELVRGDVRDARVVRDAVDGIDVVFHNVAQQPLAKDGALIESVNVGGTRILLGAALDAGVTQLVHTSSTSVYGVPTTNPVTEETPTIAAEVYGRAKVTAERLCRDAADRGLDVTIIRPRTIVGHGRLGLFGILFDWVADGVPVFVLGPGDNPYQFVHAGDLASACRLAAERPGPTSYNIGAAEFGTMRETLQALVDHAGTGSAVWSLPVRPAAMGMAALSRLKLAPFGPYHWLVYAKPLWFDITKARTELEWEPVHSNESMMVESYEWFLAHREEMRSAGRSLHQSPAKQGALRALRAVALGAHRGVGGNRRATTTR
jgi:nucleoside-diphosphate-sugar epimerase